MERMERLEPSMSLSLTLKSFCLHSIPSGDHLAGPRQLTHPGMVVRCGTVNANHK
jgi:hypothetical protein